MTERSFSDFTSGIWTSSTSNSVTTYTLTRDLAWTSGDTGISGLASTDYITLGENTIVDGGGYTITLSASGHTGIFKINSSISSINSAPIIQNIQVSAGDGLIAENAGSLIATEQNYFYLYNCTVSGTLSSNYSGGLCGSKCINSVIKNCISTCELSGNYCGGICGADYGYILDGWKQLGSKIDGSSSEQLGYSVSSSSDGTIIAIGAPNNNSNTGCVRIYQYSGGSWSQLGSDIIGEATGDKSGWRVSLSSDGTIVAIGAYYNDGGGTSSGHVRIYKWSGSDWTSGSWEKKGSDIDGEAADQSGYSVSLSSDGTIVAIGAPYNSGGAYRSGCVRIYKWSGSDWTSGDWNQKGDDIDGEASSNRSGWSVSLSSDGTIVAIGAKDNSDNGSSSGHVRIYEWSGSDWTSGNWNQKGSDIDGEASGDNSGISVSLSSDGTIVAIGAHFNDGNGSNSGHVRIYKWNGSEWEQKGSDIDGEAIDDNSGKTVSLSSDGTTVAIGSTGNDENGTNTGHVRIYEWSGSDWTSGDWNQRGSDIDGENTAGGIHGFSRSVSLSSDGSIVFIGSSSHIVDGNSQSGQVIIYKYSTGVTTDKIEKCYFEPDSAITGNKCGGIIGGYTVTSNFSSTMTIDQCFSNGTNGTLNNSNGNDASGGIAGYRAGEYNTLTVTNCFSINTGASESYYAGLLGPESGGTVTNCYSDGLIVYNSTLTESNNYDESSYGEYASSLPSNWSTSIWESTSGNYPRLKAFITDDVWSGNNSDNHANMDYDISFSEEVVDDDIVSVHITSTERNNVKNKTITSNGDEVTQLVDFSNIASGNKKSVRHSMLNKLFTNNTSINKLKMTPANLGLNSTNFDKTYIMAFEQGTDSTPQINLSSEIDENTGVYANLDNTGDSIEFTDNGGTSVTITKRSDGDYNVDDGETVQVASDDTSLVVNYYTIYFGGAGINEGQQIPCFTDTCYLLTPFGYKNVTKLNKDDLIVTADNRKVRIKNIYKTKASSLYRPYLINKGGLGNNLPTVDTYISPEHRLLHNGKWIKPKNTLFKKSWNKSEIVYYHVELPNYKTDNVICNGVVMESWDGRELL